MLAINRTHATWPTILGVTGKLDFPGNPMISDFQRGGFGLGGGRGGSHYRVMAAADVSAAVAITQGVAGAGRKKSADREQPTTEHIKPHERGAWGRVHELDGW